MSNPKASARSDVALTADEFREVTDARATLEKLIRLDGFWTREASGASSPSPDQLTRILAVKAVVDEMGGLLEEAKRRAPRLALIFANHAQQVQDKYLAIVEAREPDSEGRSANLLTSADRKRIRSAIDRHANGNFVSLVNGLLDKLQAKADDERQQLGEEYARLNKNRQSDGDMSAEMSDVIDGVALALALIGEPGLAVAVEVFAHAIDSAWHWLTG